jgi:hypothetical protein
MIKPELFNFEIGNGPVPVLWALVGSNSLSTKNVT